MKFEAFNFDEQLLEALSYAGFETATPIQAQSIPAILEGKDVLALAQTGTGKTGAFLLPILNKLANKNNNYTSTLIIAPTRELAIQIERQIQGFAYFLGISSMPVYGGGTGVDFGDQKRALTNGTDIIVATPGKLISHLNMGYVKFDKVEHLILDEADRMLDMGFFDDIQKIISYLPEKRQSLLFSATMAPTIKKLANNILIDPVEVKIAISKPAEGVTQGAYLVYNNQKIDLIKSIVNDRPNYKSILVFSSTKKNVFEIVKGLRNKNYKVEGISSDLEQSEREAVLRRFRARDTRIIVATDVISRGIDIKDINLVINYDVPADAEDYVHRIGRTARADTTGEGLTLINEKDMLRFHRIEQLIEKIIDKIPLPEAIGKSPEYNPNPPRRKKKRYSNNKRKNFKGKKRPNNNNKSNGNRQNNQNRKPNSKPNNSQKSES